MLNNFQGLINRVEILTRSVSKEGRRKIVRKDRRRREGKEENKKGRMEEKD